MGSEESKLTTKIVVVLDLFGVAALMAKIHLRMLGLIWKTLKELSPFGVILTLFPSSSGKCEENDKRLQQMEVLCMKVYWESCALGFPSQHNSIFETQQWEI